MEVIWLIIQATKVSLLCHWLRKDLKYLLLSKKAFVIIFNIIRIQYYTISGLSNLNHLWQKKKKLPANSPCHPTDVLSTFFHQQWVHFWGHKLIFILIQAKWTQGNKNWWQKNNFPLQGTDSWIRKILGKSAPLVCTTGTSCCCCFIARSGPSLCNLLSLGFPR